MPFCSTCSAKLDDGDTYCPDCGNEVVRIVDARPGATYSVAGTRTPQQQASYEHGKDAMQGAIDYTFSTMALGFMVIGIWLLLMLVWFLIVGTAVVVWVPAALAVVGALVIVNVLQRWYAGVKQRA